MALTRSEEARADLARTHQFDKDCYESLPMLSLNAFLNWFAVTRFLDQKQASRNQFRWESQASKEYQAREVFWP